MSKDNSTSIRGIHVSPGVYQKETVLTYATKNLGITTLGLAGETLKGPAFQVMPIANWREFQDTFGGTSPEKFQESQFPKYELPYVAKSYLSESNQLQVCRVLGLSGYEAGPAWVVTAQKSNGTNKYVVAVLRSRGHYEKLYRYESDGECICPQVVYDKLVYEVGEKTADSHVCDSPTSYNQDALKIKEYEPLNSEGNLCTGFTYGSNEGTWGVSSVNYGHFTIEGVTGPQDDGVDASEMTTDASYFKYSVSLNPWDSDYILKVLGTTPNDGSAPIYVESLYDGALKQSIEAKEVNELTSELAFYNVYKTSEYSQLQPIYGIIEKQEEALLRKDVAKRFIADKNAVDAGVQCHKFNWETSEFVGDENEGGTIDGENVVLGQIYTVRQYTNKSGKRYYYYAYYDTTTLPTTGDEYTAIDILIMKDKLASTITGQNFAIAAVKNMTDNRYWKMDTDDIAPVTCDLSNYKDPYRFASTPWIVSNVKGDTQKLEMTKLFRFHTISDGNTANQEVKVSIANILPDDGLFDVIIRSWYDTDASPVILERYTKCSMVKSSKNYIAYKIGSYDGMYESKSKYVTVEVNEDLAAQTSVPAGFVGYPFTQFGGEAIGDNDNDDVKAPILRYNRYFDNEIKNKKQYFGLSDIVGVDVDAFTYKGHAAYYDAPEYLCPGFHLDARLDLDGYASSATPVVTVDGESGYTFNAISRNNRTELLTETPIIGAEVDMYGSIYEYVDLRKFTCYFYGGFDGWDEYRKYRSNTDDFKMSKYKGSYSTKSVEGEAFSVIQNVDELGLNQSGITSDFYAYLAAARQFANPEQVEINVFATPGIDLINNKLLCQEVIEMLEEERADSIYVATTPDKPFGASDFESDMYDMDEIVYELEDTEIDSNYTCTYLPWVKYEDVDNHEYIYLPATKDVVRNMAITDNTTAPWFAPAGLSRGTVDCVRAKKITKIADEDTLYEGRINPIKTFARDGVKIWGQKNLQKSEDQLNRIAVRRLLLRMRKLVAIACLNLIFEPNDATTKNKFLSLVTPIMDNIKANRGLSDYRIEVNDTVESRERRELPAKIYFKPYNALEYVLLDFIVTPEGVSFDDI